MPFSKAGIGLFGRRGTAVGRSDCHLPHLGHRDFRLVQLEKDREAQVVLRALAGVSVQCVFVRVGHTAIVALYTRERRGSQATCRQPM